MPVRALIHFLDSRNVRYRCYNHPPAYTAQETAHAVHVTGHDVAKTVLLRLDERLVLAVLPACEQIELDRFARLAGASHASLADEDEMAAVAPMCDPGCVPPIGNLFGLPVYVSTALAEDEVIAFCGGTHTDVIRMAYSDFEQLVQPRVMPFSQAVH